MSACDGSEPIDDDEILYRRLLGEHLTPTFGVSPQAFVPSKRDTTGMSFFREKYMTAEAVVEQTGQKGKKYFIAVIRAGDLRHHDIDVVPRPSNTSSGHCEIPSMTCGTRESDECFAISLRLANLVQYPILGPFSKPS